MKSGGAPKSWEKIGQKMCINFGDIPLSFVWVLCLQTCNYRSAVFPFLYMTSGVWLKI